MEKVSLATIDVVVIAVYLLIVVGKGYFLSRKQEDVETYLLAGRRMSYWVVSISIIASLLSAITYLGAPTESYLYDFKFSLTLFTIVAVTPIVIYVFLPFFYRLNVYTAYQYLEERFHVSVRVIGSTFFILWRLGWMALVVYAPALAISTLFDIDWRLCVVAVGLSSTAYTVMGGLTAVIWTDVMQFFVLYGGAALIMVMAITQTDGGLGWMWSTAAAQGKLTFIDWSLDPFKRVTTWGIIFGGTFTSLAAYATDQVAIQRYLSTKSRDEARRSLIFHAAIIVPVGMIFYFVGMLIWAFYQQQPELLVSFKQSQSDRILAFFIAQQLPVGIRGALVAALFAATMSSIDSGINSIATTTLVDYYQGWLQRRFDQATQLRLAKQWTLVWGLVATGAAIAAGMWGQTLVEMSNKIAGLFSGALLAIFLLGMLTKRANWQGVLLGSMVGFGAALLVAFGKGLGVVLPPGPLANVASTLGEISFLFYSTVSCGVTLVAGWLISRLFAPPRPEQIAPPEEIEAEKPQIPDEIAE
ncbi:MAG: sodium/solute symporter [Armatimonadota bacterium]|nr:sodium/solute symporter [Armatimonadota bacterium]